MDLSISIKQNRIFLNNYSISYPVLLPPLKIIRHRYSGNKTAYLHLNIKPLCNKNVIVQKTHISQMSKNSAFFV